MTESRAPKLPAAELSPRQRELYDLFTTGPRARPDNPFRLYDDDGHLTGPPSAWVLSPEIGHALEQFGGQMRWGIHTSGQTREAVILAVAYDADSPFELFAHEPAGRAEGFSEEDLAALRGGRAPDGASEETRAAHALALELIRTRAVSDESWAAAVAVLSLPVVFEIVTLVGYYQLVALTLSAFRILPPVRD
ncbi:MAG TPA: carboxymuconolactone decarboxylase family protein [Microbacteriaceae bacterium]|nr:carboxymuconolactone decarboxylase family protein [Microbacteriaceae bacterium]